MNREEFFARDAQWSSALVTAAGSRTVQAIAWVLSRSGDALLWGVVVVILFWVKRPLSLSLLVGLALAAAATHLLKGLFKRTRPETTGYEIANDKYSFPSGHSARVGVAATLLAYVWPDWIILIIIWAVLVAMSRVVQSRHYIADVLTGLLLGLLLGQLTQTLFGIFGT